MSSTRTIIAVRNKGGTGKTSTIRELAKLVLQTYPNHISIFAKPISVPPRGDFRLVIKIKKKTIAFESKGDPNTDLGDRLLYLANNYEADVIFCTTRTSGGTVDAVENLRINKGFDTVWTSTYQTGSNHGVVNQLKAKHILDLSGLLSIL